MAFTMKGAEISEVPTGTRALLLLMGLLRRRQVLHLLMGLVFYSMANSYAMAKRLRKNIQILQFPLVESYIL